MQSNFDVLTYSTKNAEKLHEIAQDSGYSLYKHTNRINGKIYYGLAKDCKARWNHGLGYENNSYFFQEILLYGWRNFDHEILFTNLTKEQGLMLEGLLIQETKSYDEEIGYNINFTNFVTDFVTSDAFAIRSLGKRTGRGGTPVVFDGKYYKTLRLLAEEIEEDPVYISQWLNPNVNLKMPKIFEEKGLRYATQEEIEENS